MQIMSRGMWGGIACWMMGRMGVRIRVKTTILTEAFCVGFLKNKAEAHYKGQIAWASWLLDFLLLLYNHLLSKTIHTYFQANQHKYTKNQFIIEIFNPWYSLQNHCVLHSISPSLGFLAFSFSNSFLISISLPSNTSGFLYDTISVLLPHLNDRLSFCSFMFARNMSGIWNRL